MVVKVIADGPSEIFRRATNRSRLALLRILPLDVLRIDPRSRSISESRPSSCSIATQEVSMRPMFTVFERIEDDCGPSSHVAEGYPGIRPDADSQGVLSFARRAPFRPVRQEMPHGCTLPTEHDVNHRLRLETARSNTFHSVPSLPRLRKLGKPEAAARVEVSQYDRSAASRECPAGF
jgi:hypothetical protein